MTLPAFFVIGAQKCGTTTLYEDLRLHPDIVLGEKEPTTLRGSSQTKESLATHFAQTFHSVPPGKMCGEVSTRYAMLPEDPEVPRNAALVNPHAKVIYIVRDPVTRVISHHHHDFGLNLVNEDINDAVRSYPALLNNTRYATQIRPWISCMGRANVRLVRFESYMSARREGLAALTSFLGLRPVNLDPGDVAHNAASSKYIAPGRWGRISQHPLYRRGVRPLLGETLRRRLNRAVLPKAPPRPSPPRAETVSFIIEQLRDEVEQLAYLTGEGPWWDLDESLAKFSGSP